MSSSGHLGRLAACGCSQPQSQEQVQLLPGPAMPPETKQRSDGLGAPELEFGSPSGGRNGGEGTSPLEPPGPAALDAISAWRQRGSSRSQKAGHTSASDRKDGGPPLSQPAFREAEQFEQWLEQRLAEERAALIAQVQKSVGRHLGGHHKLLARELQDRLLADAGGADAPELVASEASALWQPPAAPAPAVLDVIGEDAAGDRPSQLGSSPKAADGTSVEGLASKRDSKRGEVAELPSDASKFVHGNLSFVARLVLNRRFEKLVFFVILLNCCVMALEVQFVGCQVSSTLNHPDCSVRPDESISVVLTVSSVLFVVFFMAEFLLRLDYMRMKALTSSWMWFDLTLLTFGILDIISRLGGSIFDINPGMMRAARIGRLVRIVRVLQMKDVFDTLFVILKSILATRHTLVWSVLIMFLAMSAVGMLINQFTLDYMQDPTISELERKEVYELFGTYTRMMITMGEITLGNWAPPTRRLMVNISQWWGVFILFYRCALCMALVNVTNAVFIAETNRVAMDNEVAIMHKKRSDVKNARLLEEMFREIDESGDGFVSVKEMAVMVQDERMGNILSLMELDVEEVSELLFMMSDGMAEIDREQFIKGILALKGDAKSSGQTKLLIIAQEIQEMVDRVHKHVVPASALGRGEHRESRANTVAASRPPTRPPTGPSQASTLSAPGNVLRSAMLGSTVLGKFKIGRKS